jgi:hypothetical protein
MKRSVKLISGVVLIFALLLGAGACAGPEKSASESSTAKRFASIPLGSRAAIFTFTSRIRAFRRSRGNGANGRRLRKRLKRGAR